MENKIKDIRYDLTTLLEAQATKKLKPFKMEIESNRYIICKSDNDTVKIYSPELAVILSSNSLSVINMDTNTATTINGLLYLNTYIEAYKEGENYFETQHRVSPNTLYGANAEQYVRDIHFKYFHKKHTNMIEGWESVKQQYPFILTHKAVKELGFYSGIVNKVDEQIEDNPNLFTTFDKCIHNLPTQQTETKTDKITAPVLGLFCTLINTIGIEKKGIEENATVYCQRICIKFQLPYTDRVRQNYNVKETKNLVIQLKKMVLPKIDDETKKSIEKYLDKEQSPKQNLYA